MLAQQRQRFDLLVTPLFLTSVALLALNDWLLKSWLHNWLTGKLSDFAGLFAFAMFFTALIPRRKVAVHLLIAILFVWWKLPVSSVVLDWWNQFNVFNVSRVTDATDLIALSVLPLSLWYIARARPIMRLQRLKPIAMGLSTLTFAATSPSKRVTADGSRFVLPALASEVAEGSPTHQPTENESRMDAMLRSREAHTDTSVFYLGGGMARVEFRQRPSGEYDVTLFEIETVVGRDSSIDNVREAFSKMMDEKIRQRMEWNTRSDSLAAMKHPLPNKSR